MKSSPACQRIFRWLLQLLSSHQLLVFGGFSFKWYETKYASRIDWLSFYLKRSLTFLTTSLVLTVHFLLFFSWVGLDQSLSLYILKALPNNQRFTLRFFRCFLCSFKVKTSNVILADVLIIIFLPENFVLKEQTYVNAQKKESRKILFLCHSFHFEKKRQLIPFTLKFWLFSNLSSVIGYFGFLKIDLLQNKKSLNIL
jgi:hypothetical protein